MITTRADYLHFINDERPQPSKMCLHWAGSPAKIETMRARWAAGESLWHPLDASEVLPGTATPQDCVADENKFGR